MSKLQKLLEAEREAEPGDVRSLARDMKARASQAIPKHLQHLGRDITTNLRSPRSKFDAKGWADVLDKLDAANKLLRKAEAGVLGTMARVARGR